MAGRPQRAGRWNLKTLSDFFTVVLFGIYEGRAPGLVYSAMCCPVSLTV